ncbi:hypothetical protein Tco_0443467 [Tanacetum coccineum]
MCIFRRRGAPQKQQEQEIPELTIFPKPERSENENEEWLAKAKKTTVANVSRCQNADTAASGLVLAAHIALKGTGHKLNDPHFKFVGTGAGAFLAAHVLGNMVINSYNNNPTNNPMNQIKNRVVFGLFYATSLAVPVLYFMSWFVSPTYILQSVGVAAAVAAANTMRCVLVKPHRVGLQQLVACNTLPANTSQNPMDTFYVDPAVVASMPDSGMFSTGLKHLLDRGAIRFVENDGAGRNMQGGVVGLGVGRSNQAGLLGDVRNLRRGLVVPRGDAPVRLFVDSMVWFGVHERGREVFLQGVNYLSSHDAIGVFQQGVDGRPVYVPAFFRDDGQEDVIQIEQPRIVEVHDDGVVQGEIAQVPGVVEDVADDGSQEFEDAVNAPVVEELDV